MSWMPIKPFVGVTTRRAPKRQGLAPTLKCIQTWAEHARTEKLTESELIELLDSIAGAARKAQEYLKLQR